MKKLLILMLCFILSYLPIISNGQELDESNEGAERKYAEPTYPDAQAERAYEEFPTPADEESPGGAYEEESRKIPTTTQTLAQAPISINQHPSDTITLELKNMDVVEVIKLLSSKGGYDVVISQNVRGRITLFLDNVPIWDAMQIVLRTTDLAYTKHGEILRIVTEREYEQQYGRKFHENREVKIIPLKYAPVADAGRELKQLKSRIGNVIEDDRTNSVILLDAPDSIKIMEDAILKLDVPVETKIFELQYTSAKGLEEMLKKLISKKGILNVDDLTNKIIVTDNPDVIRQVNILVSEYDKPQFLETRIFTLNHAKFDKVEEKIKDILTKDIGTIKSDERTNKIVIIDLPEKIEEIAKIVEAYDEKSRQVLIEAKIVQVQLSDEFKMGINWQLILNKMLIEKWFSTDTIDMTISSVFEMLSEYGVPETAPFDYYATSGSYGRANYPGGRTLITGTLKEGHDFDAIIDILKTAGKTNLLSSPRILVLNNQEAIISVATRQPFVTGTVVQATGTAATAANVTIEDVGIKLKVTPTIGKDGFVTLKIRPEVSDVIGYYPATTYTGPIPIVSTQEAETTVMAKDGATVIMGGLIQDKQIKTTTKVPILGSIPLLGIPFRKEEDKITKNELVIFLTPHIASGDIDLSTPSPEMMEYLERIEKERQKAGSDASYKEEPVPADKVEKKSKPKRGFSVQHR